MGYRSDLQHAYLDFYDKNVVRPFFDSGFRDVMEDPSPESQVRKTLAWSVYAIAGAAPMVLPSLVTRETLAKISSKIKPESFWGSMPHQRIKWLFEDKEFMKKHGLKREFKELVESTMRPRTVKHVSKKVAARAIPYVGHALLAHDIYSLGKWIHGRK